MIALKIMFPVSLQFTTDSKPDTQLAVVRHLMTPGTSSSEPFSFDLETPGLQSVPYLEGPALHHDCRVLLLSVLWLSTTICQSYSRDLSKVQSR